MSSVSEILTNTNYINTSVSVNKIKTTKTLKNNHRLSIVEVQQIANKLCDQLNNKSRFEYYCKLAWRLPESIIWDNLEIAMTGKDPKRLFSWLCKRSMN